MAHRFPAQITFEVPYPATAKMGAWVSPYIQLSNPESSLEYLKNPDELVAPSKIIVSIDYPLENGVECKIHSSNPNGFTRAEIAKAIADEYKRIYDEERESTILPEERCCDRNPNSNLINRAETNGKYGIWGHGLEDLVMHSIGRCSEKDGIPVYALGIDS